MTSEIAEPLVYSGPGVWWIQNYLDSLGGLTPQSCLGNPDAFCYTVADWFRACIMLRQAGLEPQVLDLIARTKTLSATQPYDREVI